MVRKLDKKIATREAVSVNSKPKKVISKAKKVATGPKVKVSAVAKKSEKGLKKKKGESSEYEV